MELRFHLTSLRHIPFKEKVIRTLLVSSNTTLEQLHNYLVEIFDWNEGQTYSFHFKDKPFRTTEGEYGSTRNKLIDPNEYIDRDIHLSLYSKNFDDIEELLSSLMSSMLDSEEIDSYPHIEDAASINLEKLNLKRGQKFFYVYDWDEFWEFEVIVISTSNEVKEEYTISEDVGEILPEERYELIVSPTDIVLEDDLSGELSINPELDESQKFDQIFYQLAEKKNWLTPTDPEFDTMKPGTKDIRSYRSLNTGVVLLIISIPYNKTYQNLQFIIDLYKVGIKDIKSYRKRRENAFEIFNEFRVEFARISNKEAFFLLLRSFSMTQELGIPISKQTQKWLRKLGVISRSINGSPFRCFLCEIGRLEAEEIHHLKEIAAKEYRDSILGTESELNLQYLCKSCQKKMDEFSSS